MSVGPDSDRESRSWARAVLRHLIGEKPTRLRAMGGGLNNTVFSARCGAETLIVRLNRDPAKLKDYLKEQWAIARAAECGVPVSQVLEVGVEPIGAPYMVQRRVEGMSAVDHPRRVETLHELGRLARLVFETLTAGFGNTFDWSDNQLSRNDNWSDYLTREFRGEERLELLERHGMLTAAGVRVLRAALARMASWRPTPALNHGDLRLKNVVVDGDGRIRALLDWDLCTSHVAPHWDMSLALHDLSVDGKEAFVQGYGLTADELVEAAPVMRAFNALNYASRVEQAVQARDRLGLERLRARLQGGYDLYLI